MDNRKDVIITILDSPYKQKKKIDLKKYMGRGEKMFTSDAQEYIRNVRDDDSLKSRPNYTHV